MNKFLEYSIFFIILLLLQVFLFNNLNLSVFINPLVYVAFIVLLPMEMKSIWVLLLGLLLGVATDFVVGTAGLNTIATLFTAFIRRQTLMLMLGKETVNESGIPCSGNIGAGKFFRYSSTLIIIHCIVFFTFESLNISYLYLTLLKVALSAAVTIVLVYFSQMLLPGTYGKKTTI